MTSLVSICLGVRMQSSQATEHCPQRPATSATYAHSVPMANTWPDAYAYDCAFFWGSRCDVLFFVFGTQACSPYLAASVPCYPGRKNTQETPSPNNSTRCYADSGEE